MSENESVSTDVLTREQMTSLLRDDASRVLAANEQHDAVLKTFEYKTRRQHYESDVMHQAAFEEYRAPLDEAENAALRITGILENGDPMIGGFFGNKRLNVGNKAMPG
jgi:hypothetical protein